MDGDYMERMAREYRATLGAAANSSAARDAAYLVERQIEWIDAARMRQGQATRTLSYLKALKNKTLAALRALIREQSVPDFKAGGCRVQGNLYRKLVESQIELFVLLDRMGAEGTDVAELLDTETRALGILGVL